MFLYDYLFIKFTRKKSTGGFQVSVDAQDDRHAAHSSNTATFLSQACVSKGNLLSGQETV